MVSTKRCAWGTCRNDSRYPHLVVKNEKGDPVYFHRFPAPKRSPKKRLRWITACHRGDNFVCSKDSYICSLYFVGQSGPTADNPDPISAIASEQQVIFVQFYSLVWLVLFTWYHVVFKKNMSLYVSPAT